MQLPNTPMPQETVLIFEKPESYFFPHYDGLVFPPFGVPQPSLRYLIYKVLYLLRLPCCSLFWGPWKTPAKTAKQVIIFDYGYQRGMERYIHRVNPDCQVSLFFWNKINRYNKGHLHFSDAHAVFSTDPEDCKKYNLKYNHIFWPREFFTPHTPPVGQANLFFLGVDKGRAPYIASLKSVLEESGLSCDIRVFSRSSDSAYRERFRDILTDERLPYSKYLELIKDCSVLLDVNQEGQSALTMRVMESIYLSKKLITNNPYIRDYDFYDSRNILVLPEEGLPGTEEIRDFLEKPFRPYPDSVLENYSFEHWAAQFGTH
ncbi:MAG: hypothetical protein NC389_02920 [Acetatifactor muris]|nr:hypothetical protein [Acetatifactor muris]